MNNIKPIQTKYAGHRFRSRLEARWAVFFDHAGIQWEYEPQGYLLPSGPYLPDFRLPGVNGGVWFEVKGQEASSDELNTATELADNHDTTVYLAIGPIPSQSTHKSSWWDGRREGLEVCTPDQGWDNYREFADPNTIEFMAEPDDHIQAAYDAARMARFEHGETPHQ